MTQRHEQPVADGQLKTSPGIRVQRPGDDDGVTPPSAPRHEDPSENPAPLTAHITCSADGCFEGPRFHPEPVESS